VPALAGELKFDYKVPLATIRGGRAAAHTRMDEFLAKRLARYPEDRQQPALDGTSGLSPYLHFGHLSVHEIFARLAKQEGWSAARLGKAFRTENEQRDTANKQNYWTHRVNPG
jgi:deoxyribodipyrimidine photo-lyase